MLTSLDLSGSLTAPDGHQSRGSVVAACQHLSAGKWPELAAIKLADNNLNGRNVKDLFRKPWPALTCLDLSWNMASSVIDGLAKADLQHLQSLTLRHCFMSAFHVAAPALFPALSGVVYWPHLARLDLSYASISMEHIRLLSEHSWPLLAYLAVSGNQLTPGYIAYLVQGRWPHLAELKIGGNDMSHVSWLEQAEWTSLRHLDLGDGVQGTFQNMVWPVPTHALLQKFGTQLDSLRIPCVVSGAADNMRSVWSWPLQTFLALQATADASVLKVLAEGCWPIKVLQLDAGWQLDIVPAMLQLVACKWALLEQVSLSCLRSDLADDSIQIAGLLASCDWPLLWKLDLSGNVLTDTFIGHLVHGKWPCLQELDLSRNDLQEEGVKHLVQGQWPMLSQLWLRDNAFCQHSIDMESLLQVFGSMWPTIFLDNLDW